ncbi:MAG TPA: hypothetical protein V6C63_14420 [Allocoleopsis sp.]
MLTKLFDCGMNMASQTSVTWPINLWISKQAAAIALKGGVGDRGKLEGNR